MEEGQKEAIIFKKFDKYGNEKIIPLYMINESMAKDFKNLLKRKEVFQNIRFVDKRLPKNLFQIVENNKPLNQNPVERYKYEKELQFKIHKFEFDPFILRKNIDTLKLI